MKAISEQTLEAGILADLTAAGYQERPHAAYDRVLCLDPGPLLDFVQATQPKEWEKFARMYGASARDQFLNRVAQAVESDGVTLALRQGIKANGCKFRLAYFRPETGLNPETRKLHAANQLTAMRQVRYSERTEHSLDLVLFLNGLPLFTVELKNPLNGQDVKDAIVQYRLTRAPREPLFALGRCLAHFAVDPDLVYVTTNLKGEETEFLPFNRGNAGGAGNPSAAFGFATAYLWREVWAPDSVLDLVQYFAQDVRERDDRGRLKRKVIFPRYHQLDTVRRLVADARERGTGQNYLIQHSAGSGKSNSIAWLAHRLVSLHDADDRRVFDSVVVVTDRLALDRQLSRTVSSFELTSGIVEHIDTTSEDLKKALEGGKQIIITTLQKFPQIVGEMRRLAGQRFALILDEAHSSQGGESSKDMKSVLSTGQGLDDDEPVGADDMAARDQRERGRMSHVSTFAFTATPKSETLSIFGTATPDGGRVPFSLYSMRQAIEEGFILDVLQNYVGYHMFWTLLKRIEDDPKYDRAKAARLLTAFVAGHDLTIRKRAQIIIEHFAGQVQHRIGGRARAMLVTGSRAEAVKFHRAVDDYIKEKAYPWRALVAFSGTVKLDGPDADGKDYTESNMNGFPESQTAAKFESEPYRLLIAANKFQTGFDQPLLHTMYVDKKLADVNAVQTLSRLNRTCPGKQDTCVLDFADNAERIKAAFERYYDRTTLSQTTDPNELYKLETQLKQMGLLFAGDLAAFKTAFYVARPAMDRIHNALKPVVDRYGAADEDDQRESRSKLAEFAKLYAFLGQVITFEDTELEQFYQFSRFLLRLLPVPREEQPRELQNFVNVETVRLVQTITASLTPDRGKGVLGPLQAGGSGPKPVAQLEALSEILKLLNERFGTDFTEQDKVFLEVLEQKLDTDQGVAASFTVNTRENARLTFEHKVRDNVQDMIDTNFKFYKQINDKPAFAQFLNDLLFDRYAERKSQAQAPNTDR